MSLGYPQRVVYNCYVNCLERTKKNVNFGDDVVYYMLDTCSITESKGNRSFQKTADAVYLICKRLCPGEWCTRSHCENYSRHCAYNCSKTRPKVCKAYKKYIEKQNAKKEQGK